jgi:hypothetical protein
VYGDDDHRIGNGVLPRHIGRERDRGPELTVPTTTMSYVAFSRVSRCRVRNHIAVFAEQRLDDINDDEIAD